MSDSIKHECGIALIRLLKPIDYYRQKYGSNFYGLNKMHLLMEKQHNRGQDGAGLANIKLYPKHGNVYINRVRSNGDAPIKDVFQQIADRISAVTDRHPDKLDDPEWMKENVEFTGEVFLGHLRYGTFGKNDIENVHPVSRENNWMTRSLVVAGNFNLTNIDELYQKLVELGQYPPAKTDTVTILERIGHFLDRENDDKYRYFKDKGYSKQEITDLLARHIDLKEILSLSARRWDGGYAMAGMIGHGDAFIMRDPSGIRPAYFYHDDEIVVAASERAVIQTSFNLAYEDVKELEPGHALIVRRDGGIKVEPFTAPSSIPPCSFERIYFSRGSDRDIYRERKRLGALLVPQILESIDYDIENTVFSYIPNTAESAFFGLVEGLDEYCQGVRARQILEENGRLTEERLQQILRFKPRIEKVAIKDVKMRTFITQDNERDDLVAHVYDITYGTIRAGIDNLVIIDDSIVRGTTLRQSIIRILDRLQPKKIVICSSAPQIRYPDCYGIDMSRLSDFVAFKAAIELLRERGDEARIERVYRKASEQLRVDRTEAVNCVSEIYEGFTDEEISAKIAQIVTAPEIRAKVEVIYQSVENMHKAIPVHNGDWYFTGNYPTPGGNVVSNKAFINFFENRNERAY
ncbi:amidophosphoribosyltransferase [uncultured Alistipes sp.]|uniref:amidophosphoribosyltransferase n=1 Tax=uncultured Alistipes sp. TaxID=538949 RepID=UPI002604C7D4|nr:amidophosphoribosyltransferase [uncultured Alistipes sp.]